MTFDSMPSTLIDPNFNQLYLEISPLVKEFQEEFFSTTGACRRAYLNQLCLNALLSWLREEHAANARVWTREDALPSFWEVVNGAVILVDNMRLVVLPVESIDLRELRVPQEWVDIPTWAGDYYLHVQVNPEDEYIRIVGYTTHQKLKRFGTYDTSNRAYCVNTADLIQNVNVLWLARQFCPDESLRAEVTPLPGLSQTQAENLLERLGNRDLVFPRLQIPFPQWGALLEHSGWRQRLYEKRQGLGEQWSIQQWLQAGISYLGQQLGWEHSELQPVPDMLGTRGGEIQVPVATLSRQLLIAGNPYKLHIFLQGNPDERLWRFELRSLSDDGLIPEGFTLRLLTEDLQPFDDNVDTATTESYQLSVEVILEAGEGLVWEIEPTPEHYEREILRF
ncbi:hypothetical protein NIES2101_25755 [Calothrix sp. HK-06]|nr:hypothetical protein NIES2101_25755 [Calothrix sp. HK-06]